MLTLTAADGTEFSAAFAAPEGTARVGVVVLPDVRGLHPYYVALAERFAETGAAAVAIDWFGRTAGVCGEPGIRGEDFDFQAAHPADHARGDRRGHHRGRRLPAGADARRTCRWSRSASASAAATPGGSPGGDLDLAGCAGFYGKPPIVGAAAERAHLPTVMVIAGADAATPVADQLRLAETMRAAGAEVDAVVYDGAPHSFFDRAYGEWAEACADAWRHVLALTDRVAAR